MSELLINCGIIAVYCVLLISFVTMRRFLTKHPKAAMPVVIMLLLVLPAAAFASGTDHTGENWLLLIGIMLCWLKG